MILAVLGATAVVLLLRLAVQPGAGGSLDTATAEVTGTAPRLADVSTADLSGAEIALVAPRPADRPRISSQQAGVRALEEFSFPGAQVRQVVLARVEYTSAPGSGDEFCWVVDLASTSGHIALGGGSAGNASPPARWFLVFINAVTGDLVFARAAT